MSNSEGTDRGRRVDPLSSLLPGLHTSFAGHLQMQAHTPGLCSESEVGG